MEHSKLIWGKAKIPKIVSSEVVGTEIHLFIQKDNGDIEVIKKPHKFWMLAPIRLDEGFSKLEGKLYYSWIKLYDTKEEWTADKKRYFRRDVYLINDEKEAAMVLYGFCYFQDMKAQDVSILAFDIESEGLTLDNNSYVYIISNTFRKNGVITRKMFSIDEYDDQGEMISAWCKWVREMDPSILCGHNILSYDIPYLLHVASLYDSSLDLGRDGSEIKINHYNSKFRKDGSQAYDYKRSFCFGREIVDTMFLAYKYDFARKYPSYGLKAIIKHEGLEIEGRQFYDAGKIAQNWNNLEERKKIKAYAEQDGDDALALYDLMVPPLFYWTQSTPKSFQSVCYTATGSQLNGFLVRSYLQDFHSIPKANDLISFEGAISFAVPGTFHNVMKIDFSALYPSLIREYKIYDKYKDPNGYFLNMVEYFTIERLKNKKLSKQTGDRYYNDLEQSMKIVVNSAYGLLGAQLNFNSPLNAALVTKKGRELLTQSIYWATGKDLKYWTDLFKERTGNVETE